jgi:hypothetical protein
METNVKIHIWLNNEGIISSSDSICPVKKSSRFKYMGYSHDIGWPKKMNTGRILYFFGRVPQKKLSKYPKN